MRSPNQYRAKSTPKAITSRTPGFTPKAVATSRVTPASKCAQPGTYNKPSSLCSC